MPKKPKAAEGDARATLEALKDAGALDEAHAVRLPGLCRENLANRLRSRGWIARFNVGQDGVLWWVTGEGLAALEAPARRPEVA